MADEELRDAERAWNIDRSEANAERLIRARARSGFTLPIEQQLDLVVTIKRLNAALENAIRCIQVAALSRTPALSPAQAAAMVEQLRSDITWVERATALDGSPPPHQCEPDPTWRPAPGRGGMTPRWQRVCLRQPCPQRRTWGTGTVDGPPRGEPHEHVPDRLDEFRMVIRCAYPGCNAEGAWNGGTIAEASYIDWRAREPFLPAPYLDLDDDDD